MFELKKLAEKHKMWISCVIQMGCNHSYAEDVVQDAYIRVSEYIKNGTNIDYGDDDVNYYYFYLVLRTIYLGMKEKRAVDLVFIDYGEKYDGFIDKDSTSYYNTPFHDIDHDEEIAFNRLLKKLFREINSWNPYSQSLFVAYYTSGLSLDRLSDNIGIGRSGMYNTLRKYREIIYKKIKEDYEDFKNGDYHLI